MESTRAVDLILEHESFVGRPYWPGGASGVTLDYGYDLAHHSVLELREAWEGRIRAMPDTWAALERCCGVAGVAAQLQLARVRGASWTVSDAREVFDRFSLPKYELQTQQAFPGAEQLPADAYGALVSLVFNRGGDMGTEGKASWDRRREMREIREALELGAPERVPDLLVSMKRLWVGQGMDGLLRRRDEEAALFADALA